MLQFTYPGPFDTASYHNHSLWSDGEGTVLQMCTAAKQAGFREFGMSEHWVLLPWNEECDWSVSIEDTQKYIEDVKEAKRQLEDEHFKIRIGLEVDYFQENFSEIKQRLSEFELDYLIGSVHYAGQFPIDHSIEYWKGLSQKQIDEIWDVYLQKMAEMAASGFFQIVGHLDLPKKFGYKPSKDYLAEITKLLQEVKRQNMAVELNTAGWFKECQEPYPAPSYIQLVKQLRIPMVISADAHSPRHVRRNFDCAMKLIQ